MFIRRLLLLTLLAFATFEGHADGIDDEQKSECDTPETDPEPSDSKTYCRKTPGHDKYKKPDQTEEFKRKYADLHAETVKLKEGSWCVSLEYGEYPGPRLIAKLWFQYGSKVAYLLIRPRPLTSGLDSPCHAEINVEAPVPFTIHFIYLPSIHMIQDGVTIQPSFCENQAENVHLDGSHVDRLLTCHMEMGKRGRCEWYKEDPKETEGADVASWFTPSEDAAPVSEMDRIVSGDEAEPYLFMWSSIEEMTKTISRHLLVSDWLSMRAQPGCLRLWLYAWGAVPRGLRIHLHEEGAEPRQVKTWHMPIPEGHTLIWKEIAIAVEYSRFKVYVEFRGDLGWTGDLVLDDVSEEGKECSYDNFIAT